MSLAKGNEGAKMLAMTKKRDEEKNKNEETKVKIHESNKVTVREFSAKFGTSKGDIMSTEMSKVSVGLVTLDQLKKNKEDLAKKETILEHIQREEAIKNELAGNEAQRKKRLAKEKSKKAVLSFGEDDGEDEEESEPVFKKRVVKNPSVDTSFLPDRQRELGEIEERKKLTHEWHANQDVKKEEPIEITFSYHDGSGHRRSIDCKKGHNIGQFLEIARKSLQEEFRELRGVASDNLLYIKEDLIIPHDMSFHYMIETKARGKSGPLFHFDVHEDIRTVNDARIEKDESHAGKIVERHWYERNKHIFPASRWEVFDPSKKWEKYSIHGGEVNGKK
mmetsp:Transcript_5398/g.13064  ORF Transcript_5398/g.13064 Transcript_5398/m.13064 type:complete len:334 (-) Transcript_5398:186-1187(-)|eukprot:CAMPEP_0180148656 /NCGR_PEP_ID=MMETSP0986-20121125/20132_1 /TAXON_ID=697907 /ORGANISM="non described non described, Strain CCMP2293" /LENGTH=333 /DNA_ID=CAMNT_0022094739 /DNA_START=48 /DNA_END=1049 /DNA_ORIENTATION=+